MMNFFCNILRYIKIVFWGKNSVVKTNPPITTSKFSYSFNKHDFKNVQRIWNKVSTKISNLISYHYQIYFTPNEKKTIIHLVKDIYKKSVWISKLLMRPTTDSILKYYQSVSSAMVALCKTYCICVV